MSKKDTKKKKKVIKKNTGGKLMYYKLLDSIRVFSCFAVLLYHLNILKGGYLAVCTFFVLSGYLSCVSALKKKNFSLLKYYKDRFIKIYIPLVIVVLIATGITLKINCFTWINLKKEIISNILGYNNFWQLNANLDYFSRNITSPFIHLWYIAILIQYEVLFPIFFIILKKIENKTIRLIPVIIPIILGIVSFVFFCIYSKDNLMIAYYNSFTRAFSLLFGIALGFLHKTTKAIVPEKIKKKKLVNHIFYSYLLILLIIFIFVGTSSILSSVFMMITSIISLRIIDYATVKGNRKLNIKDKIVKKISSISYEIYLVQYPVIFLFQYVTLKDYFKIPIIIIITFVISLLLHYTLSKSKRLRFFKYLFALLLFGGCIFGIYEYVDARDYSKEIKELEKQLDKNEDLMKQKQEEYEANFQKQKEELEAQLKEIENGENSLNDIIPNLHVVAVGDSVLLGAVPKLYEQFPNGYFDGKVSRTAWSVNDILEELKEKDQLGDPIILNLGANGDCTTEFRDKIMETIGDKQVFWMTVTNDDDVHFNDKIKSYAANHDNLHIIDWNEISKGHNEYFYADGIHLTNPGVKAYIKAIYDAIYEVYDAEYAKKKEEVLKEHEESIKDNITFYGNEVMLNIYDSLQKDYKDAKFVIKKNYTYNDLKTNIETSIKNNVLTNKIVIAFDENEEITKEQYEELIKLCSKQKLYFISISEDNSEILNELDYENIKIIDLYPQLSEDDTLMVNDKKISSEGNDVLKKAIKKNLN